MYVKIHLHKVLSNMKKRYLELMGKTADLLLQVETWNFIKMSELLETLCVVAKF